MKVVKTINTKLKNTKCLRSAESITESELINVTENFLSTLHQETIPKPSQAEVRRTLNVAFAYFKHLNVASHMTRQELKLTLSQMKNERAPGDDGIVGNRNTSIF